MTGARDLLTGTDLALNFAEIPTVFIGASAQPDTLDIGVTRDFWSRVPEHRPDLRNGSQSATALHLMGYHEMHDDMTAAIRREKQLKKLAPRLENPPERADEPGMACSLG